MVSVRHSNRQIHGRQVCIGSRSTGSLNYVEESVSFVQRVDAGTSYGTANVHA